MNLAATVPMMTSTERPSTIKVGSEASRTLTESDYLSLFFLFGQEEHEPGENEGHDDCAARQG